MNMSHLADRVSLIITLDKPSPVSLNRAMYQHRFYLAMWHSRRVHLKKKKKKQRIFPVIVMPLEARSMLASLAGGEIIDLVSEKNDDGDDDDVFHLWSTDAYDESILSSLSNCLLSRKIDISRWIWPILLRHNTERQRQRRRRRHQMLFHLPSKGNFKWSLAKHLISSSSSRFDHISPSLIKKDEEITNQSICLVWIFIADISAHMRRLLFWRTMTTTITTGLFLPLSFFLSLVLFCSAWWLLLLTAVGFIPDDAFQNDACTLRESTREKEKERKIWIYYREEMRLNEI